MSALVFDMISRGQTAEFAAEVEAHPHLAIARDPQGVSALLWSVYVGQSLTRDFLRTRIAHPDIFEAAALGATEHVESLLAADPGCLHAFSGDGWTPLHLAAAFADPETVCLLIERGADVRAVSKNPQQNQPLHAALALGSSLETVRLLLDAGADPNAAQAGGFAPLHSAASAGRREAAQLLVERGADPAQKDHHGHAPSHYACQRGHEELASWLDQVEQSCALRQGPALR